VGNGNSWHWLGAGGTKTDLAQTELTMAASGQMTVDDDCSHIWMMNPSRLTLQRTSFSFVL
jgi:hypothetical protein